jgi:hypothetical protein
MICSITSVRHCGSKTRLRCDGALAVLAVVFSGCYGDFGRPRPSILTESRAYSIGAEAANALGAPASPYELTDDEKFLREYAYGLIRPAYSRERWYVVLGQLRRVSTIPYYGETYDYAAYARKILSLPARSPASRYAQLIDGIRNDMFRLEQFTPVASRVVDIDRKRDQSFAYVSNLTADEIAAAKIRMGENAVILSWVRHCLEERAAAYHYTLERLIVATPSTSGVESERALTELETRIADMYTGWSPPPASLSLPNR